MTFDNHSAQGQMDFWQPFPTLWRGTCQGPGTVRRMKPGCALPQSRCAGTPQPSTLNPPPSTLNPRPSTLTPQPATLNLPLSTLNPQPSTLNPQPSTLNPQHSTRNPHPSTIDPPNQQPASLNPRQEQSVQGYLDHKKPPHPSTLQ